MRKKAWEKAKERESLGPQSISETYLNGVSEQEYRKIYNDNVKEGIIYALHKHTPKRMLTMSEIGEIIGWGRCAVKNNLITPSGLTKTGLLRTSIKKFKGVMTKSGDTWFYLNNPAFSELFYDELRCLYLNKTPPKGHNPNGCELGVLIICNELYPQKFSFTGARKRENCISGKYPDIKHDDYPIIIEHAGGRFHDLDYEEKRVKFWKGLGYHCLVIWNYDERDKNIHKNRIKEFVDNAIQNF
jgi:hypothetical protein